MIEALPATLRRAEAALERGEATAASTALQGAALACEEARRRGVRLDARDLAALRAAYASCVAASERARDALDRSFRSAGTARLAAGAYRR